MANLCPPSSSAPQKKDGAVFGNVSEFPIRQRARLAGGLSNTDDALQDAHGPLALALKDGHDAFGLAAQTRLGLRGHVLDPLLDGHGLLLGGQFAARQGEEVGGLRRRRLENELDVGGRPGGDGFAG